MKQPPPKSGITFTRPSPWVWYVSFDGKHVATVNGDISCGFIARDLDHHWIGHGYISAEDAIQACVPVTDSHLSRSQRRATGAHGHLGMSGSD